MFGLAGRCSNPFSISLRTPRFRLPKTTVSCNNGADGYTQRNVKLETRGSPHELHTVDSSPNRKEY